MSKFISNMAKKVAFAVTLCTSLTVYADVIAPTVTFNQSNNANISTLSQIVIDAIDDSNVSITEAQLSNSTDTKTIKVEKINVDRFRVIPEYLDQDAPNTYTLTVTAEDAFGNSSSNALIFNYVPSIQSVSDIQLPAIASALRSAKGVPHNVLKNALD